MTKETIIAADAGRRPAGRVWLAALALTFCGAALIAGCSTSSTSTTSQSPSAPPTSATSQPTSATASPTTSASQAVCVHINSLRTSLTDLTHIKVSASSAGQLTKDLTNIQTQLAALKGQSLGAFSTSASQLMASLNKINKDAEELGTNPTAAAKALSTDLTALKNKAGPMITEMKTICHMP